ncbi:putative RNA-directed DNA polymerase [Tanacetum coccineum]
MENMRDHESLGIYLKTKIKYWDVLSSFMLSERRQEENLNVYELTMEVNIIPFDAVVERKEFCSNDSPKDTTVICCLAEWMNRLWLRGQMLAFTLLGFRAAKMFHIVIYELYDPVQKRLVRSRDVVFEEDQTLKDNNKEHDEEQGVDDVDAHEQPNLDEDVHPELPVPDMPPFLLLRRSTRDHHPSTCYSAHEYVLLTDGGEPECYAEAMEDEHKKEWFEAMEDEMNSLHENNIFELVKLPKGKRALKNKWVYKLNTEEHTSRLRYKARLVVKGFSQKRGIDFDDIFSLVVKMGSIQVVLCLGLDLEVEQMDVKTSFHWGGCQDKELPEQPEGKQGYEQTSSDHVVSFQMFGDDDLSSFCYYADIGAKKLHISQGKYIEKVYAVEVWISKVVSSPLTTNFKLTDKDWPSSKKNIEKMDRVPYASAVGSLMYVMVNIWKWENPCLLVVLNQIWLEIGHHEIYLEYLCLLAGADSWQSRLQKCVAFSTTKAEYMAATEACKKLLWLKRFLQELGFKQQRFASCDIQSCYSLLRNSMFHKRQFNDYLLSLDRDAIEDGIFET